MIRASLALCLCLATLSGCGKTVGPTSTESLPSTVGPHGGTAFPLPDAKGYAEFVVEVQKASKAGREVALAVYFLKPDLASALEPAPTDVGATLAVPGQEAPLTVRMTSRPRKPGDGRFATEVGPYDFDEMRGEVTGSLDGKTFTIPIAVRQ